MTEVNRSTPRSINFKNTSAHAFDRFLFRGRSGSLVIVKLLLKPILSSTHIILGTHTDVRGPSAALSDNTTKPWSTRTNERSALTPLKCLYTGSLNVHCWGKAYEVRYLCIHGTSIPV